MTKQIYNLREWRNGWQEIRDGNTQKRPCNIQKRPMNIHKRDKWNHTTNLQPVRVAKRVAGGRWWQSYSATHCLHLAATAPHLPPPHPLLGPAEGHTKKKRDARNKQDIRYFVKCKRDLLILSRILSMPRCICATSSSAVSTSSLCRETHKEKETLVIHKSRYFVKCKRTPLKFKFSYTLSTPRYICAKSSSTASTSRPCRVRHKKDTLSTHTRDLFKYKRDLFLHTWANSYETHCLHRFFL